MTVLALAERHLSCITMQMPLRCPQNSLVGVGPNDVVLLFNLAFLDIDDYDRIFKLYRPGKCKGVCGNGIIEPENGEECDDGNNNDSDSCSNTCKIKEPPVSPAIPP
jgi:cysteine-rich repeat protein